MRYRRYLARIFTFSPFFDTKTACLLLDWRDNSKAKHVFSCNRTVLASKFIVESSSDLHFSPNFVPTLQSLVLRCALCQTLFVYIFNSPSDLRAKRRSENDVMLKSVANQICSAKITKMEDIRGKT